MKNEDKGRRAFLKKGIGAATAMAVAPGIVSAAEGPKKNQKPEGPFKLKYAPSLGAFREHAGQDPIDQIQFCYDQGFRAIFDNGIMHKDPVLQEKIANKLAALDMELGPFVLYADFSVTSFVNRDEDTRKFVVDKMKEGVQTAKRVNAKWALVVPGRYDEKLHWDYQTANVVENLKYCAEVLEPAGLTIVLEPLNTLHDHPGLFLTGIPQAYMICKAVDSPSVKIVDDVYHQQITEGNLLPNIEYAYEEIAAFHLGDNPGRREPTTGEINFKNVFKYLHDRKYNGVLCMEHGKSKKGKKGEIALLEAYRECDNF